MARPMATRWRCPPESCRRQPLEEDIEAKPLGGIADAVHDQVLCRLSQRETEAHVLGHIHVRIERIGLKHHGDIAILWRHVIDDTVADPDLAGRNLLKPRYHPQKRGLATAGRADEDHEFSVGNRKVDSREHIHGAIVFLDIGDGNGSHRIDSLVSP